MHSDVKHDKEGAKHNSRLEAPGQKRHEASEMTPEAVPEGASIFVAG